MTISEKIDFFLEQQSVTIDYIVQKDVVLNGTAGQSIDTSTENINNDFSIFLLYEKTNVEASVLWSAYTNSPESGFLIGLTASNKIFVTIFHEGQKNTIISETTLASKNAICISRVEGSLSIEVFDFNAQEFIRENFNFDSTNVNINETEWYLGEDPFDTLNLNNLEGTIDYFVYFNDYLNWGLRQLLFRVFYNNLFLQADGELVNVTGTTEGNFSLGLTSEENQYEYQLIGTTTGEDVDVYGWVDITEAVQEFEPYWNKVGELESISVYYEDQDIYVIEFAQSASNQVVGRELQIVGSQTIPGKPIYEKILIEDNVDTYTVIGNTEQVELQFTEAGFALAPKTSYIKSFGMDYVTYSQERSNDWPIVVTYADAISLKNINKNIAPDSTPWMRLLGRFDINVMRLFLNGLLLSREEYVLSGRRAQSNGFQSSDAGIYDVVDNSFQETAIAEQSDFDNVPTDDDLFYFFNGQLLQEGEDYTILDGDFVPSSELETETGMMISITFDIIISYMTFDGLFYASGDEEVFSFAAQATITQDFDYRADKFPRNTSQFYLNGVRLSDKNYIEHSSIDLIPGNYIKVSNQEPLISVNNDEEGFWE